MKQSHRRLWLERLEDRSVPAVAATVLPGGLLYVTDSAAVPTGGNIEIVQTANNTFQVKQNASTVATGLVATNIRVALTAANDTLEIDLNGKTFNGSVVAFLGSGDNTATVFGNKSGGAGQGVINGFLQIYGGTGIDDVTLDGSNPSGLKVGMGTIVNLDGNVVDFLTTTGNVNLNGGIAGYYINWVNLNSGTTIGQNAFFYGGTGGNKVTLAAGASVGKNFTFAGYYSISNGGNTVNIDGTVGQDLIFNSSVNNVMGHSLTLTGSVARDLLFYGGSQDDTLDVASGATVGRNLVAYTGAGNDTVTLDGTVGAAVYLFLGSGNDTADLNSSIGAGPATTQVLFIDAGAGDDAVTLAATASINGKSTVLLGAGADTFKRTAGAFLLGAFLLDGGAGIDGYGGGHNGTGITAINIP